MPLPLRIAFVIRDPLPPLRSDVLTLFGEQLPRHGIGSTLIGQAGADVVTAAGADPARPPAHARPGAVDAATLRSHGPAAPGANMQSAGGSAPVDAAMQGTDGSAPAEATTRGIGGAAPIGATPQNDGGPGRAGAAASASTGAHPTGAAAPAPAGEHRTGAAAPASAGEHRTGAAAPAPAPAGEHPSGAAAFSPGTAASWPAGAMRPVGRHGAALASLLTPFWDALGLWRAWRRGPPIDAIQVRDKIASALPARLAAAVLGVPFLYWMSFPIVEGYEARRDELGRRRRGPAWLAHALRARLARAVLYRMVLPAARHVFVQSDAMAAWLAGQGVVPVRMSAVPMGVDTALFDRARVVPAPDARLDGRRVVVYLGRVARSRNSAFLLDLVDHLIPDLPELLLVIAGDAPSADEMAWMRQQIGARKLERHVLLTGWLPQAAALGYAVRAEVGLSPIPRGALFDVSSPTKLVEYLALGIPSVANDIPDQQLVISQSRAGLIAPMAAAPFSAAVRALLADPALRARYAARGPAWVRAHRSYATLARDVADTYRRILPQVQGAVAHPGPGA